MRESVARAFRRFTANLEGYTLYMYLDVNGYVHTGIGNLIDSPEIAASLEWRRSDGSVATKNEVIDAWNTVKARQDMKTGGGVAYAPLTTLRLRESAISELVAHKLSQHEAALKRRFPAFEAWPADAQLGILSMAWALGPNFKFQKFEAALKKVFPDFFSAAEESHIREQGNLGVIPRNIANRILFENAAQVLALGLDPAKLYYPGVIQRDGSIKGGEPGPTPTASGAPPSMPPLAADTAKPLGTIPRVAASATPSFPGGVYGHLALGAALGGALMIALTSMRKS